MSDLRDKDKIKCLEDEIARLKIRVAHVDNKIPLESGGSGSRIHYDVFPAIPAIVTDIELGGYYWHAGPGDTVWTLDSFVFTDITGEVGTS